MYKQKKFCDQVVRNGLDCCVVAFVLSISIMDEE